jgi:hypothetical protein
VCLKQEGFERLLHIVKREGIEDGGIIVCDCLKIMHNILRGNKLTQKLFLQVSGVPRYVRHDLPFVTCAVWC